ARLHPGRFDDAPRLDHAGHDHGGRRGQAPPPRGRAARAAMSVGSEPGAGAGAEPVRRRRARPSGRHALGSLLVHALALTGGVVVASARPPAPDFLSHQIELVALPGAEPEEVVVEAPPAPPQPEPEPEPVPVPEPEPEPEAAPEPA